MRLGVTGHRLKKLGEDDYTRQRLQDLATAVISVYQPDVVVCGMEWSGWDKAIAQATRHTSKATLVAAIPFEGHTKPYLQFIKDFPKERLKLVFTRPGEYSAYKMQIRNEYIVDNCDKLVALWNGQASGTKNCWDYAEGKVERINVWNSWTQYKEETIA